MEEIMKKTDFILIGLVVIIAIVGIVSSKGTKAEEVIEYPLALAGEVGLNEITYDDYLEMVNNNEAFVVVIERTGCSYCQMYMPLMEEVTKELKIPVTYINTDNLTTEELNLLSTNNKYLKKNQWGTPTTLFMKGDRIIDSIGGYVEKDAIKEFFEGRVVVGE